jgi:hypothetical protein
MIGEIFPEEYLLYQSINKNVESDFQKTFTFHGSIPLMGLGLGILSGLSMKLLAKKQSVLTISVSVLMPIGY